MSQYEFPYTDPMRRDSRCQSWRESWTMQRQSIQIYSTLSRRVTSTASWKVWTSESILIPLFRSPMLVVSVVLEPHCPSSG